MANTLVVLAAGIGSRYGGLKQLDPVGPAGEFIIDYSVFDAKRAGFDRVLFVIRPEIEDAFRTTIGQRIAQHVPVSYAMQELSALPSGYAVPPARQKPWGTGHAVLACADQVSGPFAVINADDFYGRESYEVLCRFLSETADDETRYSMVGFRLRNTLSDHGSVARGICRVDDAGRLAGVVERTSIEKTPTGVHCAEQALTGDEWVSLNMWGFKPSIFRHLAARFRTFLDVSGDEPKMEFFMPTVVDELIREGKATTDLLRTGSPWFGSTYPEDKPLVASKIRALIDAGDYPASLWG